MGVLLVTLCEAWWLNNECTGTLVEFNVFSLRVDTLRFPHSTQVYYEK